jgi:hypothetical protein
MWLMNSSHFGSFPSIPGRVPSFPGGLPSFSGRLPSMFRDGAFYQNRKL